MNEELFPIIKSYLRKEETDYALLITGPWGCGKSYYWRTVLQPEIEALDIDHVKKGNEQHYRIINVSLNGISSKDEIISQIIANRFSKGNEGPIAWELFSAVAKSSKKVKLIDDIGTILSKRQIGSIISPSDTVLCFDDLERSEIKMQELLGYINTIFIERYHYKVIFISNELPMIGEENSSSQDYKSIKEKYIGRTLRFRLDLEKIIKDIIHHLSGDDTEFTQFIDSNTSTISSIVNDTVIQDGTRNDKFAKLTSGRVENIRIVRFALELLYEMYVRPASNPLFESNGIELIVFTFMVAIEFKYGHLTAEDYLDDKGISGMEAAVIIHGASRASSMSITKTNNDDKPSKNDYPFALYSRYYGASLIPTLFIPGLYEYILTGYYNDDAISEQVSDHAGEPTEPHISALRTLQRSEALEDDEFIKQSEILIQSIKDHKWSIYAIMTIYQILAFYIKSGILKMEISDLHEDMVASVPQSKAGSKYDPNWIITSRDLLPERFDDDELMKSLLETIIEADKELRDDVYRANASQLLEKLIRGEKLTDIFSIEVQRQPILEHLDATEFSVKLNTFSNEQIRQFSLVLNEVSKYKTVQEKKDNSEIIDQYKMIIDNEISAAANKPYRLCELNRLKEYVEKLRYEPEKHESQ